MTKQEHQRSRPDDEIDRFLNAQNQKARRRTALYMLLVVLFLLVALGALSQVEFINRLGLDRVGEPWKSDMMSKVFPKAKTAAKQCDSAVPPNGNIYMETPFAEFRDDFPRLEIVNRLQYPIILRISSPDQSTMYQTVSVYAGNRALLINIPPGTYGISTMVGTLWCSMNKGFLDGTTVPAARPLELQKGKNQRLIFAPTGPAPRDLQMAVEEWNPAAPAGTTQEHPAAAQAKAAPVPKPAPPAPTPQPDKPVEQRAPAQPEASLAPHEGAAPVPVSPPIASAPAEKKLPAKQSTEKKQAAKRLLEKKTARAEAAAAAAKEAAKQTEREEAQARCYDYYAAMRDQIVARMQFSAKSDSGHSFREDLTNNEINYRECLSTVGQ